MEYKTFKTRREYDPQSHGLTTFFKVLYSTEDELASRPIRKIRTLQKKEVYVK